jgi:hypothetical protein
MIATANTRVHPRTVMIIPVNTVITNITVSTPWQSKHMALSTDLTWLELLKQSHKVLTLFVFDHAWVFVPG